MMIPRNVAPLLIERLDEMPAVALIGPRQVGKTTLAREVAAGRPSIYLDLETPAARAKLSDPASYLAENLDKLVVLDEVHRMPDIFQPLRSLIDEGRRTGRRTGRYLLLGSASVDLLHQSGESLAGRIGYLEMGPIQVIEAGTAQADNVWSRGGFPDSLLAKTDAASLRWRVDFIRTYLERDMPQFGVRIPAETLRRFWTMLAHYQGSILNAADLARALGVDGKSVASYLDLLVDLLLVRRLKPWSANVGKRVVKSPKVYIRDSGLLHSLLGLSNRESVLEHPIAGSSWEGYVLENLIAAAPFGSEPYFYRTSGGAEIDLILALPDNRLWAIEVKRSSNPVLGKGFFAACDDIKPDRKFVIYPGQESYTLSDDVRATNLFSLASELAGLDYGIQ